MFIDNQKEVYESISLLSSGLESLLILLGLIFLFRQTSGSRNWVNNITAFYSNSRISKIHLGYVWSKGKGQREKIKIMYLINLRNALHNNLVY